MESFICFKGERKPRKLNERSNYISRSVIAFLAVTLAYADMPPGKALYQLLGVPETEYPVLGVPTTLLVQAIINGVIYGVVAWLIFSLVIKYRKRT